MLTPAAFVKPPRLQPASTLAGADCGGLELRLTPSNPLPVGGRVVVVLPESSYGDSQDLSIGLWCQTYWDLWGIGIVIAAAVSVLWG